MHPRAIAGAKSYFQKHSGPLNRQEYDKFREENPDFSIGFSTLKGYRTYLIRHRIMAPTAEDRRKPTAAMKRALLHYDTEEAMVRQ